MKYKEKPSNNAPKTTTKKAAKTNKKTNRKKRFRRGVLITISLLFALVIGVGIAGYKMIDSIQPMRNDETIEALANRNTSSLKSENGVKNILLLGLDSRRSDGTGLSDTLMLISINSNTKKISMVSFLRDMWVEIPGSRAGSAKINSASSWGGVPLAIETIEHNFKIKIDSYILVTFEAFREAVDAMDNIYLPLTEAEAREMRRYTRNSKNPINLEAADNVLMNGREALMYSRIRMQDDDWKRTNRQRTVMTALAEKAKSHPVMAFQAMQDVMEYFESDMINRDFLRIFTNAPGIYKYEIKEYTIPWGKQGDTWNYQSMGGQSAIVADMARNRKILNDMLYSDSFNENND